MDDWLQPADDEREDAAAGRVLRARAVDEAAVDELAAFLDERDARRRSSSAPAPTTRRRGRRSSSSPSGSSRRSSRSRSAPAPASRRTTALFAGFLPADRPRLRERLAPYDAVLVVGAPRVPPVAVGAGPLHRAAARGSRSSATTRTRCTAARSSSPCSRRPRPAARALAGRLPQRDADAAAAVPPAARPRAAARRASR